MHKFKYKTLGFIALLAGVALPVVLAHPALAADGSVTQLEDFIRSIIKVAATLAGLTAAGFFVVGGFIYITSSGDPERLVKAKHTMIYSAIGLVIVIAAYVLANGITELATTAFGK